MTDDLGARLCDYVALRKESVDRNIELSPWGAGGAVSLSARRAWIEMDWVQEFPKLYQVALRKESVDRNLKNRRNKNPLKTVALRKESVDRNRNMLSRIRIFLGRSPQGERG